MIERRLFHSVESALARYPAVALLGPRQVGKTTLAQLIAAQSIAAQTFAKDKPAIYLDLELPSDLAKLTEPELYLASHQDKLVILDEIQRSPDLFQVLRGLIDAGRRQGRRAGRFLVLGSASIELLKQSAETLAGRIAFVELAPFDALEIGATNGDLNRLWLRGGFPDSFLAADDSESSDWRIQFIRTYLERDIPQLGPRIPAETLRRFWTMLAHSQGGPLNAARLASGLGISGQSVARYLDLLVDLLLVRRLPPWTANAGKRLVKSPKVYVRDSGIVHALLGLETEEALLGHPVVGLSWEGFVIENLLSVMPPNVEASYYRTSAGAEIDLVLSFGGRHHWAIEVKRAAAPKPAKGFKLACEDIQAEKRFVVYPGEAQFPLGNGVEAIGLIALMNKILAV